MSEDTAIGYVYILENDSMPGTIKIGRTSRDSVERARELSSATGVPTPFKVAFELPSAEYEKLEREMHIRLANYRVASNREFFKYPVDKAISLLGKLETEKQNGIGTEVVRGENNFITRVLDFFRRFSQPKREESSKIEFKRKVAKTETAEKSSEFSTPNPSGTPQKSHIIIKDRTLQSEHNHNSGTPSLNGKPYYSEENGFYWAANHQGIAECVPQHIKRIIHHEELEIASTREALEQ